MTRTKRIAAALFAVAFFFSGFALAQQNPHIDRPALPDDLARYLDTIPLQAKNIEEIVATLVDDSAKLTYTTQLSKHEVYSTSFTVAEFLAASPSEAKGTPDYPDNPKPGDTFQAIEIWRAGGLEYQTTYTYVWMVDAEGKFSWVMTSTVTKLIGYIRNSEK